MDYTQDHAAYPSSPPLRRPELPNRTSSSKSMQVLKPKSADTEQVVTRLLRTTKTLLEALTSWSQLRTTTGEILDLHDTLEKQFFLVSQAFNEANVPMNDLSWIPRQLRESVSAAMEETPSPASLDQHLPRIRDVIVHLLHGLKGKQQQLRERDLQKQQQQQQARDAHRTDSWHRDMGVGGLSRGISMPTRGYPDHRMSPPPPSSRLTSSDYEPRSGGMPRPSLSSDSRMKYPNQRSSSTSSSSRPYSPPMPGSPSYSSLGQPTRIPSPSRSTSSTRSKPYTLAPPAPPPPPPPPVTQPTSVSAIPLSTSPKPTNDFDENDPNTASALAALKRQENLARRSSVRRASMFRATGGTDYSAKRTPPVPPLPAQSETSYKLSTVEESTESKDSSILEQSKPDKGLTLYLQIGKDVKKVFYEGEISMPSLRMLFIERFGYSSRQNDFPSIYVRDPSIGVSYELENLEEVKDKAVLSLNINENEVMQQRWKEEVTKAVGKEIEDMKRMLAEQMEGVKQQVANSPKADEEALRNVVRKVLEEHGANIAVKDNKQLTSEEDENPEAAVEKEPKKAEKDADTSRETATASVPVAPSAVAISADELRSQLNQIDTLRRDISVMRQLQREIREETNSVIGELKEKAQSLREQEEENANKGSQRSVARLFIEEGKEKLLTSSDKITARLEDLQDTIDQLKLDVTQRKCRPSEAQMTHCSKETKALAAEIEEFGNYIKKVKPTWKKTWEQELQTIVKEQQSLKEQEGLLLDMKDDLDALLEVFDQLEKIYAYQAKAKPVLREFRVAPAEEGFEGMSSVLKQVATIDVDHDRRLRALEQSEKMRQRELANRIDDFEKELGEFVDAKKLKKTGGALEIDRLRQQKDQDLLKALYKSKTEEKDQEEQEEAP
ncbi:Bud site selection protein 6 [Apophysomyces ossiformis]|uniref:Bud site selection protein 6 n=1 Tax=Apophysomyces ossiformis TaxID=679940 RepID=A0A8H7EKW3_9FUNG|nr:Bud site selection protein 6 [Apophysomyces ossiformis]